MPSCRSVQSFGDIDAVPLLRHRTGAAEFLELEPTFRGDHEFFRIVLPTLE